jgi:hypothetical protein
MLSQTIFNKARRDKFQMVFDLPLALKRKAKSITGSNCTENLSELLSAESIQFSIYGTPVPKVTVSAIDAAYAGQVHKNTSFTRPEYAPLTIGMSVDNRFLNYWLLWTWINLWNDTRTGEFEPNNLQINTINPGIQDYITSFTIYGLDEYDNRIISFRYKNVIITELSEIEFSYRNTEEIGCTATFVFDQMYVDLLSTSC